MVLNSPFSHTILMMGPNTAEGNRLSTVLNFFSKTAGSEDPIVTMVMSDGDPPVSGKTFKGMFGFNGLQCRSGFLEMNVVEIRKMIHKYG